MRAGIEHAVKRLKKIHALYEDILAFSTHISDSIVDLNSTIFFDALISYLGPCVSLTSSHNRHPIDFRRIFNVVFHKKSRALLIANKGVSILSLSPFTSTTYITRHIACSIYHPSLGIETANIGLIGNVYEGDVIVRGESACPPSFLFGSQRCNCSYQWASIRELAAYFHGIDFPKELSPDDLERWIEGQFFYRDGKHIAASGGQGLILIHLDSQAGMGSGFTQGEFVADLYNRALMRQLAGNTVEQVYHTSIKEGYEALGLPADPRKEAEEAGYQIPAIVLDWLQVSKNLIVLSNNHYKLKQLQNYGFHVKRVKSLGKIHAAGKREAKQRGEDFQHLDMNGEELSFDQEITRLKEELMCIKTASVNPS